MKAVPVLLLLFGCLSPPDSLEPGERERLKQEILAELQANQPPAPAPPAVLTAGVAGRLLAGDEGLAHARVRIVRWEVFRSRRPTQYRTTDYYDATTDEQGAFHFEGVDSGEYRLLWAPPGAGSWVRYLVDQPDVVVGPTGEHRIPDVQTRRRILDG